jgi:hypothetical protein
MNTVYIVTSGSYSDYTIHQVFQLYSDALVFTRETNLAIQRENHEKEKTQEGLVDLAVLQWARGEDGNWISPSQSSRPTAHSGTFEKCRNEECRRVRRNPKEWKYCIEEYPFTAAPEGVTIPL